MAKKNKFKYRKKNISNATTYRVLMFIDVLFAIFCLTLFSLYLIGNYQHFQDSSQHIILNTLAFSSIFTALLSVLMSVETIIKIITEKKRLRHILALFYLIIAIIVSVVCIVVSCAINYISLGE